MEKLELKHFLQHYNENLDILVYGENGKNIDYISEILLADDCIVTGEGEEFYYNSDENNCEIKLILRPLSDLFELFGSGHYEQWQEEWITHLFDFKYKIHEVNIEAMPYDLMEFCFQNHIDVHGLIKKGLAVDINTI